jgi:hypothetical protein
MSSGYKKFLNRRKWQIDLNNSYIMPDPPDTKLFGTHSFQIEINLLNDATVQLFLDPYGTSTATPSFSIDYKATGAPQTYMFNVSSLPEGDYNFRTEILGSTFFGYNAVYQGGSFEPNIESSGVGPYFEPVLDLASCDANGDIRYLGTPSLTNDVTINSIDLSWSQIDFATAYQLDRSTDQLNWNILTTTDPNTFKFSDSTFLPNTNYYYRIKAKGNNFKLVDSSFTQSAASAGLKQLKTPILTIGNVTANSIQLNWLDVTNEIYYVIYKSLQYDSVYTQVGTFSSGKYIDTGLTASTVYHYKIKAKGDETNYIDSELNQISIRTND